MRVALAIAVLLHLPLLWVRRGQVRTVGVEPVIVTSVDASRPIIARSPKMASSPRSSPQAAQPSERAKVASAPAGPRNDSVAQSLAFSTLTALGNAPPAYPDEALARGWEGEVRLLLDAGTVHVTRTSGHAILDEAAVAAARAWRLPSPGGRYEVPVVFRIE